MKCDTNFFYNENVGSCFACSDICDNLKGTGNTIKNCLKHCPDYMSNETTEIDTESHNYLKIILPICLISVLFIIIATFLVKRQGRYNRCKKKLPVDVNTPAPPVQYTVEEVGDDDEVLESLSDSGIDSTRVNLSAPQTGLSDMPANTRYLWNASDASGAQETLV